MRKKHNFVFVVAVAYFFCTATGADEGKSEEENGEAVETVSAVQKTAAAESVPDVSSAVENPAALNLRIDAAIATLSKEPSLADLRRAALSQADAGREVSERWKRGARFSAILPTLKLGADFSEGRDESLDRYQDDPDRWGADTDRGFGADISLQWKLDRLIFNTDELKVFDELADRAIRRENLTALLISVYFERRRLQLEWLLLPPGDLGDALERRMRIEELGQTIDALTGGLLSSKMTLSNEN